MSTMKAFFLVTALLLSTTATLTNAAAIPQGSVYPRRSSNGPLSIRDIHGSNIDKTGVLGNSIEARAGGEGEGSKPETSNQARKRRNSDPPSPEQTSSLADLAQEVYNLGHERLLEERSKGKASQSQVDEYDRVKGTIVEMSVEAATEGEEGESAKGESTNGNTRPTFSGSDPTAEATGNGKSPNVPPPYAPIALHFLNNFDRLVQSRMRADGVSPPLLEVFRWVFAHERERLLSSRRERKEKEPEEKRRKINK
ncbi:hypothetical protein H0H93_016918 [Arthromyces matolae]|nr:hypothetical protein H0H93_016918 [Arthromyces matolae]